MTHIEFRNKLLPHPFSTNCVDYNEMFSTITMWPSIFPTRTKAACFERCVRHNSLEDFGVVAPGPLVLNNSLRLMSINYAENTPEVWKKMLDTEHKCEQFCKRPDCEHTFFAPMTLSATRYDYNVFIAFATQLPTILVIYDQKTTLITYITSVVSLLGFWLGLSVLHMYNVLWSFIVDTLSGDSENNVRESRSVTRSRARTVRGEREKLVSSMRELRQKLRDREYESAYVAGQPALYQPHFLRNSPTFFYY